MPVEIKVTDTRSVQVPVPANQEDTIAFSRAVVNAVNAGYELKGATTIEGGGQRDPYTVGVRLTFSK